MGGVNDSVCNTEHERIHVPCDLCGEDDPEFLFVKNTFRHVRCSRCGMVYVTPRLRETAGQQKTFYDNWKPLCLGSFEEIASQEYSGRRKKRLLAEADTYQVYNKTGYILDIGCGFGGFLKAASEKCWTHPAGIEIAPQAAAYVQQFFPVKTTILEEDPYENNLFDVVRLNNVIEHVSSPRKLVEAVHHILRPGGLFVISTPHFDSYSVTLCGSAWQYIGGDDHIYLFSPKTLTRLLEETGFQIIRLKTKGLHMTPKNHGYRPSAPMQRLLGKGIREIERCLDIFVRQTSKGHRLKIWAEKVQQQSRPE